MESEKKKRFVRKIAFRVLLAAIVGGAAVMIMRSKEASRSGGSDSSVKSVEANYATFLEQSQFEWSVTDKFKAAIKLASAYPYGQKVRFRFDGYLSPIDKPVKFEMQVAYDLQLADHSLKIEKPQLVSFDLDGVSAGMQKEFADAGATVFALFVKDAKTAPLPLDFSPAKIISMTTSKILLK